MMFAHHIELTIFGQHFEPEGVVEHVTLFTATAVVLFLAAYGAYTLVRRWFGTKEAALQQRP